MDVPVVVSLTPAAIQTIYRMKSSDDNKFFVPTVQVYRIKKNVGETDSEENWSVALSDGQFYLYGICDSTLVNLIHSHIIAQNSIIRVLKFEMTTRKYRGRDIKVIHLIQASKAASNPGYPVGTPVNIQDDGRNVTNNNDSAFVDLSDALTEGSNDGPHSEGARGAFFSATRKGTWQDEYRDYHHRKDMVKTLARLLSEEASTEKAERIPTLAKQIELILYQQAPTFGAYIDMSTLRGRLKELENSIPSSNATSKA